MNVLDFRLENLPWLVPAPAHFRQLCRTLEDSPTATERDIRHLANYQLNIDQLIRLAKLIGSLRPRLVRNASFVDMRLAILSDTTVDYTIPALVATAARFGVLLEVVHGGFGQIAQAIFSPDSILHKTAPDAVLISQDPRGLGLHQSFISPKSGRERLASACAQIDSMVRVINDDLGVPAILQTVPPPPEEWCGSFDRVAQGSSRQLCESYNRSLTEIASRNGNLLFDAQHVAALVGYDAWYRPSQWTNAKLPFSLDLVPLYADHLARLLAALRGKSRKCLVLDLDNTLWGGIVGDDGVEGLRLGNGTADGEAHLLLQSYALQCKERGIILAVCSKNEMAAAVRPFREHPEMLLKEDDIAVFLANWEDKASNLAQIAKVLNIGTDALVFVDDNPAERERVRQMLPEVAVPELFPDPAYYARALGCAGYFEAIAISEEDSLRADFYRGNAERTKAVEQLGNLDSYLESLQMVCVIRPFDEIGRSRIAQLINKSNQFNLTTRRYTEKQVGDIQADTSKFALQIRLIDKFGDNGMISVVIFDVSSEVWACDTWLMSCRVLGRRVETAVLNEVVSAAKSHGALRLRGRYIPSAKNSMVQDHFGKLGFSLLKREDDGTTVWELDIATYAAPDVPMLVQRELAQTEPAV
ncbi:MAG: HAD-IIIC family phosphatase [Bradyrhizobium sp.]|uniref:HAD-IIIC family phosphatase n=1 Tax=Bradyrhizobium sp. TaxID=376 RepID=UPI0025BCB6C5|nr:HAD-IIIC family phosphatase [Bradyrhizobium sp.]MBI5265041.1 HAD-IIIC family phosphatase [Bradyrhizobium sp.]